MSHSFSKLPGRRVRLCLISVTSAASTSAFSQTTNAVTLGGGLPDTGASVFRVFGALLLVIAVFFAGVWLFRNWRRFAVQRGAAPNLNIIEVKSLGQRQAIYVVGYQQQRMLLASSPAGVTLLSHLPAAEESNTVTPAATEGPMSFASAFQQVLARKR